MNFFALFVFLFYISFSFLPVYIDHNEQRVVKQLIFTTDEFTHSRAFTCNNDYQLLAYIRRCGAVGIYLILFSLKIIN